MGISRRWETDAVPGLSMPFTSSHLPVMQADALQCLTMSHKREQTSLWLMYHGRAHTHICQGRTSIRISHHISTYLHITYAHIPVYPTVLHKHASLCTPTVLQEHTSSLLCHLKTHSYVSYLISTHPCLSPCHADTHGPYRREALEPEHPPGCSTRISSRLEVLSASLVQVLL